MRAWNPERVYEWLLQYSPIWSSNANNEDIILVANAFLAHAIYGEDLALLTEDDLAEMQVLTSSVERQRQFDCTGAFISFNNIIIIIILVLLLFFIFND